MLFHLRLLVAFLFPLLLLTDCGIRQSEENFSTPNRLEKSGSPYLREHADNPVDWHEWSTEALEKAKKENKPLIISIGYAACHWCHVMEEETFMDTAVARIMNENFVSIKIDREERPDIDQIYLDAAQMISGNSGWPLNAFAMPDGKPFYAGTYFPKQQWIALLEQVIDAYKNDHDNVTKQAQALTEGIRANQSLSFSTDSVSIYNEKLYREIFKSWTSHFDYEFGGLSGAPKFPMPVIWEFLLQYHHLTGDKQALQIVTTTLDGILNGGVYDVLAGGFARYSVDDEWKVPHFEKMLYDNGQLVSLLAHAYQVTNNPVYSEAIVKTLDFIKNEMTSPEGGFYSSLNADSEREEGKFYVWTKGEIENILDSAAALLFIEYYNITDSGNWEAGKNILYRRTTKEDFAAERGMSAPVVTTILANAEKTLFGKRKTRIQPSLDDKILVSWNALMLKGYIDAYFALGDQRYLNAALENARFMDNNILQRDGRLSRNYKDGESHIDAFLEDYALLAKAFIHLYQATFDIQWLDKARSMTEYAIAHFRDQETGMFYFTSMDAQNLITRRIETADNVIPASNSVLAEVLFLLAEYYSMDRYAQMSNSMLNKVAALSTTGGPYYANWASLIGLVTYQPYEVAIVGRDALAKGKQMLSNYLPTALFMGGSEENLPLLENKGVNGRTIIYVCRNRVCKVPEEDVGRAMMQLSSKRLQ
jgi:uncharacterized protein YyaL (SSP411 family)